MTWFLCNFSSTPRSSEVDLYWKTKQIGMRPFRAVPRASRPSRHEGLRQRCCSVGVAPSDHAFLQTVQSRRACEQRGRTTQPILRGGTPQTPQSPRWPEGSQSKLFPFPATPAEFRLCTHGGGNQWHPSNPDRVDADLAESVLRRVEAIAVS